MGDHGRGGRFRRGVYRGFNGRFRRCWLMGEPGRIIVSGGLEGFSRRSGVAFASRLAILARTPAATFAAIATEEKERKKKGLKPDPDDEGEPI